MKLGCTLSGRLLSLLISPSSAALSLPLVSRTLLCFGLLPTTLATLQSLSFSSTDHLNVGIPQDSSLGPLSLIFHKFSLGNLLLACGLLSTDYS